MVRLLTLLTVPLLTRLNPRYLCDVEADQGERILVGRY